MTALRTYTTEKLPSGVYRVLSDGKPLRPYFTTSSAAYWYVDGLLEKQVMRAMRSEFMAAAGIAPKPRDSKRQAAYRAERVAGLLEAKDLPPTTNRSEWLRLAAHRAGFPVVVLPVVTTSARKRGGAYANMNRIVLCRYNALNPGILIHEYAHVLTWDEDPAHGPRWAAAYVLLCRAVLPELAHGLHREMHAIGLLGLDVPEPYTLTRKAGA